MNFNNPETNGNVNVKQPKILACTLKEYQLKGLNWLANLYEQGINGILADEMVKFLALNRLVLVLINSVSRGWVKLFNRFH